MKNKLVNMFELCQQNISLLYLFLIIPFVKPAGYVIGPNLEYMFQIWRIIVTVIILLQLIKIKKLSKISLLLIGLQTVITLSTFLAGDNGDIKRQLIILVSSIAFILLVEFNFKNNKFLTTISAYTLFMVTLNVLFIMIFKDGMVFFDSTVSKEVAFAYGFLGYDNSSFFITIGSFFITSYLFLKDNKPIPRNVYIIFIFITLIYTYVKSYTAAFCLITFLVLEWISRTKKVVLKTNYFQLVYIITFISLCIFKVQNLFLNYIGIIFGKEKIWSIKFRGIFWSKSQTLLCDSPILGFGRETNKVMLEKFNIDHLHNFIMEITYQGGIIALVILIYILSILYKKLKDNEGSHINNVFIITTFMYLFAFLLDYYANSYIFYAVPIIIYNFYSDKNLNEQIKRRSKQENL